MSPRTPGHRPARSNRRPGTVERRRDGLALLELLIAQTLLTVGLLSLLQLQTRLLVATGQGDRDYAARLTLQHYSETARLLLRDGVPPDALHAGAPAFAPSDPRPGATAYRLQLHPAASGAPAATSEGVGVGVGGANLNGPAPGLRLTLSWRDRDHPRRLSELVITPAR